MDYKHKIRNHINQARRAGSSVELDEDGRELDAFLDVYYGTMQRRNAAERYYLPRSFFERLIAGLPGRFVFGYVRAGGAIVSVELALVSARCAYAYMAGTRAESFRSYPNELLKHEIVLWAKERGLDWYVLGGGVSGEDSLFEYKRRFAPGGVRELQIGQWVLDPDTYDRLVRARDRQAPRTNLDFFPAYRAP
jgi:lipid II:glycine glycyltransferase (peptidoglycan interpeptide bridge formation enzyme)